MKPFHLYRRLWVYVRPHVPLFVVGCVCMAASQLFNAVSLTLVVPLVDRVFTHNLVPISPNWPMRLQETAQWLNGLNSLVLLHGLATSAFLILFGKILFEFFQNYLMNDVALRVLRDIRNGLYEHLMQFSIDFYTQSRAGALVSRVTYDVSVIQNSLTEGLADFVRQIVQVMLLTSILFALDWKLACIVFLLFPALAFPMVRLGRILRKIGITVQERMGDINASLVETFSGMTVIKAFLLEHLKIDQFRQQNFAYYKANVRSNKRMVALGALTETISTLGGVTMMVIAGQRVMSGRLSAGMFTLFIGALVSLVQPFKRLSRLHSVNEQASGAAQRIIEVLDSKPSVREVSNAVALAPFSREIRYNQVRFRYPGTDKDVLQKIDLTIKKAEFTAFVGPSGAGKTTVVNLLPRFYDPTEGQVAIDGLDLRQVTIASLRQQIGIVTQETFLFHDSVRANIAFGRIGADHDAIVAAAKAANAHDFIMKLPQQYDTVIGERGLRLSGGERQRLAIARALLRNPPILILDEATSQLDTESERLVQEALSRLTRGRTVFAIAHRLSTVRRADRIVVIEQGKVVEMGRHQELIEKSGLYRHLCELQFVGVE